MLILSIDTSGKAGGMTLAEGDGRSLRVIESSPIAGGTFSAQLVPTLASLLEKHGRRPRDIEGFVAVSGPGSFTGLRVGLSAIKGLAEVLRKPIATVSVLEALAVASGMQGRISVAMDAGRGEIFYGRFDVAGESASKIEEEVLSKEEFLGRIGNEKPEPVVASDERIAGLARSAGVESRIVEEAGSELAARIGLRKLLAGETIGVEELDANYVRKPEAELYTRQK